jgi:hypothetical protein
MSKKTLNLLTLFVLLSLLLFGCSDKEEATAEPATSGESQKSDTQASAGGDVALKITGKVENEMAWSEEEVRAMDTMDAESTNKSGETKTYTGVSLNALLELAGVQADAANVVFVADDGFTAETPLADVQACQDCIVSFRNQGGFSMVMPGFDGKAQVKGVVEIQAQ